MESLEESDTIRVISRILPEISPKALLCGLGCIAGFVRGISPLWVEMTAGRYSVWGISPLRVEMTAGRYSVWGIFTEVCSFE